MKAQSIMNGLWDEAAKLTIDLSDKATKMWDDPLKALAEYGKLTNGRALIIGAFDKIEIWDPKTFESHVSGQSESYEDLAERVMGGI